MLHAQVEAFAGQPLTPSRNVARLPAEIRNHYVHCASLAHRLLLRSRSQTFSLTNLFHLPAKNLLWRETEYFPAMRRRCVVLLGIAQKAFTAHMPAARPDTAFD